MVAAHTAPKWLAPKLKLSEKVTTNFWLRSTQQDVVV